MTRVLGILATIIGFAITVGSIVAGGLAHSISATLVWLAPEAAGCMLVLVGLRAWGDP